MNHLHAISCFAQKFLHLFANQHRAVLATRTPEPDGQIALALAYVVWNQVDQKGGNAVDKLLRLRKRANVLRHLRMPSRIGPERWDEMRIGQETHIKEKIGIVGHSGLVPEADD